MYRSDLEYDFSLNPPALQSLIDSIEKDLTFAIEVENGVQRSDVANYDEVRGGMGEEGGGGGGGVEKGMGRDGCSLKAVRSIRLDPKHKLTDTPSPSLSPLSLTPHLLIPPPSVYPSPDQIGDRREVGDAS